MLGGRAYSVNWRENWVCIYRPFIDTSYYPGREESTALRIAPRHAKFIPSLEGRGFLWQFCNDYSMWKWTSTLPERGVVEEKEEHGGEERGGAPIGCER